MDGRPIWMPDTSAVNALADDQDSDALIAGLRAGYFVRFPFTVVSEIVANTSRNRRGQLLRVCKRLLQVAGDCIEPDHEIIRGNIAEFESSDTLEFARVYLRLNEAEREILAAENFDDDLAAQEREESRIHSRAFDGIFSSAKIAFDRLVSVGTIMPSNVGELVDALQQGGAFWNLAKNLYDRVAKTPATDETVREFYRICEPFRALMLAIFAAQFDLCVRPPNAGPSFRSGRNDTIMATCLPYCDEFVTNDVGQLRCYREVVSLGGINVKVRSYEDFRNGFSVLRGGVSQLQQT